jgi:quercetin dioxygenase-like cupin family protein
MVGMLFGTQASAQHVPEDSICKPVSERTEDIGCWVIAHQPLGKLPNSEIFWHLYAYPTRAEAEGVKGSRGTVVESLGKIWLLAIESKSWRPAGGERMAQIGPLPIDAGEPYSAQYMEAIFAPGMTSRTHIHSGPEAWYTVSGETCLETPKGKQVGRPGGEHVIVPGGLPMHLTAIGTETRRALVLILHKTSKPSTTPVHDWVPRELCTQ